MGLALAVLIGHIFAAARLRQTHLLRADTCSFPFPFELGGIRAHGS